MKKQINKLFLLVAILLQFNINFNINSSEALSSSANSTASETSQKNDLNIIDLPKTSSLKIVQKIIEKSKIPYKDIIVVFDFDETLKEQKTIPLMKDNKPLINSKTGKQATEKKYVLKGGKETQEMLDFLNKNNINWFIFTAAERADRQIGAFKNLKLESPQNLKNNCDKTSAQKKINAKIGEEKELSFGVCDNIINIMEEAYRYHKHLAFEFAIKHFKLPYPKLVIFVDDNAANVEKFYNNFKTGMGKNKGLKYYGIIYGLSEVAPEEGHAEAFDRVSQIIEETKKKDFVSSLLAQMEEKTKEDKEEKEG